MLHGFSKAEHLCLQRDIDALFDAPTGSANAYPLRCIWRTLSAEGGEGEAAPRTQVLISVAKRHLHHAVDRNRAKRQVREAYRLQKQQLAGRYHIAFIWLADAPQPSAKVHQAMGRLLHRIP